MKSFFSVLPLLVSAAIAAPVSQLVARDSVTVHFTDTATTYYGENIFLAGSIPELGNWAPSNSIALSPANYPKWDAYIDIPANTTFQYKFIRKQSDGSIIWEQDPNRVYTTGKNGTESSNSTFNGASGSSNGVESNKFVQGYFSERATTYFGENIYLVGSIGALGNWNPSNAILLSSASYPVWTANVTLPANTTFQFKFIRKGSDGSITWENDPNRQASTNSSGAFYYSASFNGAATTSASTVSTTMTSTSSANMTTSVTGSVTLTPFTSDSSITSSISSIVSSVTSSVSETTTPSLTVTSTTTSILSTPTVTSTTLSTPTVTVTSTTLTTPVVTSTTTTPIITSTTTTSSITSSITSSV